MEAAEDKGGGTTLLLLLPALSPTAGVEDRLFECEGVGGGTGVPDVRRGVEVAEGIMVLLPSDVAGVVSPLNPPPPPSPPKNTSKPPFKSPPEGEVRGWVVVRVAVEGGT